MTNKNKRLTLDERKKMSELTQLNTLHKNIVAWGRCNLLHKKRPFYTGNKVWVESTKEWREEILWVCDICQADEKINSEKREKEND